MFILVIVDRFNTMNFFHKGGLRKGVQATYAPQKLAIQPLLVGVNVKAGAYNHLRMVVIVPIKAGVASGNVRSRMSQPHT